MELRPFRALRGSPRYKERRPGLWIDRQVLDRDGHPVVLPVLVGLVRLSKASGIEMPKDPALGDAVSQRVGALVSEKTDSQPCVLVSRAPIEAALTTTRRPDFTVHGGNGRRHDFLRINDYAQHVELQGLVKSVEAELVAGRELWEAARQFSDSPAALRLPGAKYKLCAIVDQRCLRDDEGLVEAPAGVLGFAFEDPVY